MAALAYQCERGDRMTLLEECRSALPGAEWQTHFTDPLIVWAQWQAAGQKSFVCGVEIWQRGPTYRARLSLAVVEFQGAGRTAALAIHAVREQAAEWWTTQCGPLKVTDRYRALAKDMAEWDVDCQVIRDKMKVLK